MQRKDASAEWKPLARQVDGERRGREEVQLPMTLGKREKQEGPTGTCKALVWREPLEALLVLLEGKSENGEKVKQHPNKKMWE